MTASLFHVLRHYRGCQLEVMVVGYVFGFDSVLPSKLTLVCSLGALSKTRQFTCQAHKYTDPSK